MTWIAGLAAGVGVTVFGSIRFMSGLARELAETSLLLELSSKLPAEEIHSVLSALLRQGQRRSSPQGGVHILRRKIEPR